ncbi:MAG: epoxyqueuosine reductase [Spirochaetales bacterium]|nr:epoxyqueuosine reductase [Spirochaetales bacterium]
MISTAEFMHIAKNNDVSFAGVANLVPAFKEIELQGGRRLSGFPRAVSIGVSLPNPIVDGIADQNDRISQKNYRHHGYDVINARLDQITSRLASLIQDGGFSAYPIAASQVIDRENHLGTFSHKLAARLAGLGWIGKSCLLITPTNGPRVRWASILTDSPFEPTGIPMEDRCGTCTKCVDICPPQAFTGRAFHENEPRPARFDAGKCAVYQNQLREMVGVSLCGLCLQICPFGTSNKARST